MKIEDGGSAFPGAFSGHCGTDSHADPCGCYVDNGMSLRDYFAGKAINGVQISVLEMAKHGSVSDDLSSASAMARTAYEIADAMIAARAQKI
jgi:hypothetical protein